MNTKLIWITPDPEKVIGYCARVSNPSNQKNENVSNLLSYCIKNKHYSVFEMANMCVEIKTSRAISAQILRHRSFTFQEFSQRYSEVMEFEKYDARRQDNKNRQNSIDDIESYDKEWFRVAQERNIEKSMLYYKEALGKGIAKEQARMLLPLNTATKLYMNGTIRSWIHYIDLRSSNGTQKEHIDIANNIKNIFIKECPIISKSLGWDHI